MNGGMSIQPCTCAAVNASLVGGPQPHATVLLVDSTTADKLDPNYDLGLPAGTPVCFIAMKGEVNVDSPNGSSTTFPYSFQIYEESPWRISESGATPTQPTPASDK